MLTNNACLLVCAYCTNTEVLCFFCSSLFHPTHTPLFARSHCFNPIFTPVLSINSTVYCFFLLLFFIFPLLSSSFVCAPCSFLCSKLSKNKIRLNSNQAKTWKSEGDQQTKNTHTLDRCIHSVGQKSGETHQCLQLHSLL